MRVSLSVAVMLGMLGMLGMLVVAAPVSAQARVPGWTYTMNMTTDSGGSGHTTNMAMRYAVTDTKMRQEFLQVSGMAEAGTVEGMYMIVSAADSTMTMVMPNQHAASITGLPLALDAAKLKFTSHVNTRIDDLGDGGQLFGHATRHYRVTMSGTIDRTTASGQVCSMRSDGVNDMWVAPDIDIMPAMKLVLKQFGVSDVNDLVQNSSATAMPKGLPLRMIMRHGAVTSTMEYRDVKQTTFDASYFDVPSGFTTMDLRKMAARLPQATLDSIQQAVEAKSGGACGDTRP